MIKAIIFDLDGTLLNTIEDIGDAANFLLKENNFPEHCYEDYKSFVGHGADELFRRALPVTHKNEENIQKLLIKFQEIYTNEFSNKTIAYDDINKLLTELQNKDIKLTILSNKPHQHTPAVVKQFLGQFKFEIVLGVKTDAIPKPDPNGATGPRISKPKSNWWPSES